MRVSTGLAVFVLLAAACHTPPEVVPNRPNEPKTVEAPPFALTKMKPTQQSLYGLSLELEGAVGDAVKDRELSWTAKHGDQVIGSGTTPIEVAADHTFSVELPVQWGETTADLQPFQEIDTVNIFLETKLGDKTATRAVQVRSPKLPTAKMLTVQASRTGPQTIGVTFLISLRNPNLFDVRFSSLQYKASLAGKDVNDGTIPGGSRIPPAAETQFEIPVEANPENCGKDIHAILKKEDMPWAFTGKMRYGKVELPIALDGDLKVSQ